MREILFRGKKVSDGEWIEGYYQLIPDEFSSESRAFITKFKKFDDKSIVMAEQAEVIPETVGQYTGLTDKNDNKIFEGDFVKCKDYLEVKHFEFQGYIDFKNGSFVIIEDFMTHYRWLDYEVEVIGNIHDNPELLKGRC